MKTVMALFATLAFSSAYANPNAQPGQPADSSATEQHQVKTLEEKSVIKQKKATEQEEAGAKTTDEQSAEQKR